MGYPDVGFAEFLIPNRRPYLLGPAEDANLVGMRLYGFGPFHRELKPAHKIRKKSHYVIRQGDVIYNKLFAWKGTFGIVPKELDGMFVSDKFPTYTLDSSRVLPAYLVWYFRYPPLWEQARQMSTGSAALSKLTLNPPLFPKLTIPLPPVAQQRRIVAKIDRLAEKIEEARGLRDSSQATVVACDAASSRSVFQSLEAEYGSKALDGLIQDANYGTSVKCHPERDTAALPILRIPNVASERINLSDMKYGVLTEKEEAKVTVAAGDLLVVRTNGSADLVGRCAVVPELEEAYGFASYLIRMRCDSALVDPAYMQRCLRYLRADGQLFDFARTTAGQYNVSLGRLRGANIPVPPLPEQRRILAYLDDLQAKVEQVKALQAKTAAELDALLPSILDKAFKGEL